MVIPCLCLFTALRTLAAEPPVNKKRTRTLFRKESGSSTNCMVGRAVRQLAERNSAGQDWTEASVLRRFNALATAEEITEISHHLRGMIQLLSAAKDGGIPLDYPQLAADLYELQCTDPRYAQTPANVRLRWGQDLYRDPKPAPEEKEKENGL